MEIGGNNKMIRFKEWAERNGIEIPKESNIPMSWFHENGLPAVVHCSNCEMTIILFSAMIDEDGYTYCPSCGGAE